MKKVLFFAFLILASVVPFSYSHAQYYYNNTPVYYSGTNATINGYYNQNSYLGNSYGFNIGYNSGSTFYNNQPYYYNNLNTYYPYYSGQPNCGYYNCYGTPTPYTVTYNPSCNYFSSARWVAYLTSCM